MKRNTLNEYKVLLVTLITSLSITGISFLDNKIWNLIMLIIGMIAYFIVGLLFSLHLLDGKNAGKEAYVAVFIVLVVLGFYVYQGIISFQKWIYSLALWIKILIPSILILIIIGGIAFYVYKFKNCKKIEDSEDVNKC